MFEASEFQARQDALRDRLVALDLDAAVVLDDASLYWLCGTCCQGAFVLPRQGDPVLFVRRNPERARLESPVADQRLIRSFRSIAPAMAETGHPLSKVLMPLGQITASLHLLIRRHLPAHAEIVDGSAELARLRSRKSPAEIELQREAGRRLAAVYERIPGWLRPGISEWELGCRIRSAFLEAGDSGLSRLSNLSGTFGCGHVSFGPSACHPTSFDGPGGCLGQSAAQPIVGSQRRLEEGVPVLVDFVFAHKGYFVDCTRCFCLGDPPAGFVDAQAHCLAIEDMVRRRLRPGQIPSSIWEDVLAEAARRGVEEGFMGARFNRVSFVGHGIGLYVDDFPVLAPKFDEPLVAGQVLAVEPKIALGDEAMAGVENTWLVTEGEAECLTPAGSGELVVVGGGTA